MTCFAATDEINNNSPANKLIAFFDVFTAEMNREINLPNSEELLPSQMMSSKRLWEKWELSGELLLTTLRSQKEPV